MSKVSYFGILHQNEGEGMGGPGIFIQERG